MATFDVTKPENIGRPLYWDLQAHIRAIECMIMADEIEIAFDMCDRVPAWYRDNYPKELTDIKKTLWKNLYDSYEYSNESAVDIGWGIEDAIEQYKGGYFFPRADILKEELKNFNAKGIKPWICELSPSNGAMIIGLIHDNCEFTYYGQNLNAKATDLLKSWLPNGTWRTSPISQPKILVCFESLEHTYREKDIQYAAQKLGHDWDQIYLSVPYGCLFGGLHNWDTRKLGHVRGYTTNDFIKLANEFFPGYEWTYVKSHSQVLKGVKPSNK